MRNGASFGNRLDGSGQKIRAMAILSYALRGFLCAHLAISSATAMAQQKADGGSGSAPVVWSRNDIHDAMARGPVDRLTAVVHEMGGFNLALVCNDPSKQTSSKFVGAMPLTVDLLIGPVNQRLKYKLYKVPQTANVTTDSYGNGTATLSGGGYSAWPMMKLDDRDATRGDGSDRQVDLQFVAPLNLRRLSNGVMDDTFGTKMSSTPPPKNDFAGSLVDLMGGAFNRMASQYIYTVSALSEGHKLLVRQQFEDDSIVDISLDLQDPTLHNFVDACGGIGDKTRPGDSRAEVGGMKEIIRRENLPAGGGGGVNNPNFKEPTLPLLHAAAFQGDLADFNAVLPQFLRRAALKWKMPEHSLDAESEQILKNAAQCSSLTPQAVAALSPADRSQLETGHNFPKWQACESGLVPVSRQIRQYDPKTERGVTYTITPIGGWQNAQAIEMKVQLTGLPGDGVLGNFFDYYGVVDAKIRVAPNGPSPDARTAPAAPPDAIAVRTGGLSASTDATVASVPANVTPAPTGLALKPEGISGDATGRTAPKMNHFQISPRTIKLHESVTGSCLAYSASGNGSVIAVMMRAKDLNGRPGSWGPVQRVQLSNTVDDASTATLNDVPPSPGKYWYGIHLFNQAGREIFEPAPILVTVTP